MRQITALLDRNKINTVFKSVCNMDKFMTMNPLKLLIEINMPMFLQEV